MLRLIELIVIFLCLTVSVYGQQQPTLYYLINMAGVSGNTAVSLNFTYTPLCYVM